MKKPFLRSVKTELTREHIEVLVENCPGVLLAIDPDKIDYERGRLFTHRERSVIWDLNGREYEIILKDNTLTITPGH